MNGLRTYLDYNASAPLRPQARAAMLAALEGCGNASSIHHEGRAARALMEDARVAVAKLAGVRAKNVTFTSGGTEAANLALTPGISARNNRQALDVLLASAGEHACVLAGHRFEPEKVKILPLDREGGLDLAALAAALNHHSGQRVMLALQHANNETGVIQPVAEAAAMVHSHGGLVVCDAVQSAGKLDCTMVALGADFLVLSAHKLGGPKGAGALVYDRDTFHIRQPLVRGGGQETGARAGTENVAAIAGFGAAAEASLALQVESGALLHHLRDGLELTITSLAPDTVFFGARAARLPNTSAFAIPGLSAETLLIGLDLEGIAVSSGSACSSGKVKRSHVLDAMGVEAALANGALRVSLGWASRAEDVAAFAAAMEKVLQRARRMKAA